MLTHRSFHLILLCYVYPEYVIYDGTVMGQTRISQTGKTDEVLFLTDGCHILLLLDLELL